MKKRPKVGLALGGGGARGLAHIGVLKALERQGIPINLILGTSMGALVGAAYAVNPDVMALEKRVSKVLGPDGKRTPALRLLQRVHRNQGSKSDLLHRVVRIAEKEVFLSAAIFRNALFSENDIRECVESFLPDIDVKETIIPFAATAVDLVSGQQVVLKEGSLIRAVMASCAVPGFIRAVRWEGMILVDGGVEGAVPAGPAKSEGANVVIGVDVGACLSKPCAIEDGIDMINRAIEIMSFYLSKQSREGADVLIEPDVRQVEWTDFLNYEELIYEGEKAAESEIENIREMLNGRFRKRIFRWSKRLSPGSKIETIKRHLFDKFETCC